MTYITSPIKLVLEVKFAIQELFVTWRIACKGCLLCSLFPWESFAAADKAGNTVLRLLIKKETTDICVSHLVGPSGPIICIDAELDRPSSAISATTISNFPNQENNVPKSWTFY